MAHEGYQRSAEAPSATPRAFGLLLTTLFALLAALAWWKGSDRQVLWAGLAAVALLIAWLRPQLLRVPLRGWMALGRGLAAVFNPIVLALMFGLMFVPIALWFRLRGRDVLSRRFDPDADSYWIARDPKQELGPRMSRPF